MRVACPICRKQREWEGNPDRPFCSERCRMIDLGAWVAGEYTVPVEDSPPAVFEADPQSG